MTEEQLRRRMVVQPLPIAAVKSSPPGEVLMAVLPLKNGLWRVVPMTLARFERWRLRWNRWWVTKGWQIQRRHPTLWRQE